MGIFPPWRNGEAVINGGGTDGRVIGEDARQRRNGTEGEKNERRRDENNRKHEECESLQQGQFFLILYIYLILKNWCYVIVW